MTPRNVIRNFAVAIANNAFLLLLPGLLYCQTDLTEISPQQAESLIIDHKGRWILEAIDSRPVSGECVGKVYLEFLPDHNVKQVNCLYGHISSQNLKWAIHAKGEYDRVLDLGGAEKQLLLKDNGKGSKHEYHMRLRQNDVTDPKGGMNLEHDYKLTESKQ